jgi:Ca2+-binding RTX toxin-like protein
MQRSKISSAAASLAVLAVTGAAIAASPMSSAGRLTVAPPAYFTGTSHSDTLYGTPRNDVLLGRGGNDTVYALPGNDVADGGIGNDRTYGGKGRDVLRGGVGNDRLYARDGRRDVINGGPGFDEAWVDQLDVVTNVERLHRR